MSSAMRLTCGRALARDVASPEQFGGISWRPERQGFIVGGGVDDALYVFARRSSKFVLTAKIALAHKAGLGADVRPQAAGVAFAQTDAARWWRITTMIW